MTSKNYIECPKHNWLHPIGTVCTHCDNEGIPMSSDEPFDIVRERQVNDAVLIRYAREEKIVRVVAVLDDGRVIVNRNALQVKDDLCGYHSRIEVEPTANHWPIAGHWEWIPPKINWLWPGHWKFVPNV